MTAISARRVARSVPGDGLLHPVPLLAIGLLVVNDHVLKQAMPGLITGKISDFAGLAFFPLFLQAAWEVTLTAAGRTHLASRRVLAFSVAATALSFAAIKVIPVVNDAASRVLDAVMWVLGFGGFTSGSRFVLDATDLVALPSVLLAYYVGLERSRRNRPQ